MARKTKKKRIVKRTRKGNVTAAARKRYATLPGGRFPIFDRKSAISALHLRGHAKSKQARCKIIRRAAKYAPAQARAAWKKDGCSGSL